MRTKTILMMAAAVAALSVTGACSSEHSLFSKPKAEAPVALTWQKTETGVVVTPTAGEAKKVRLDVMTESIIHVTAAASATVAPGQSLIVRAAPKAVPFEVSATGDVLTLKTAKVSAEVSLQTGKVSFRDASGKLVLAGHDGGQFTPVKIDGKDFFAVRQEFNRGTDEGFYGLGQHQNGQMNYNGEDVILAQHNMDVAVPLVVSTKNYGVLWDNYSITRFGYPAEYPTLSAQLTLYDAKGNKGGLTARYADKGKLLAERVEADPNYQFIEDTKNFPAEVANPEHKKVPFGEPVPTSKTLVVTYDGALESQKTGVHKMRVFVSGYFKLWLDGKLVMDSWRQGWQGWYRNIDVPMVAGQKVTFKAEWKNEGSAYLRFLHLDPLSQDERHELSLHSDVAKAIDYYYIGGSNLDDVIAGYRHLTGTAPLMPEWSYGFWQSRQRYENQDQLVGVFQKYRALKLPIDAIVQDWRYWKDPEWGSHDFDATRFPKPQKMFDDIHSLHGKLMIVIWPKFDVGNANFKEFDDKGLMYRYPVDQGFLDFVAPGYVSSNYDAYSQEARDIYWKQIQPKLDVLGPDAWWMDNDEPDIHSNLSIPEQIKMRGPTVAGPGAEFYNSYPLMHVCGFYDHWQAAHPDSRTFILTRSGFAGLQRCSAAVWSGDIASRWSDMKEQISAGVNFGLSGVPNWTFDIGGYTMEDRYSVKPNKADKAEWTELYTRWFEFGAFVPVFRSHGELVHRETFEVAKPGTPIFNILASYERLRYRLLPYIYAIASDTYHRAGTMMRGLVMDFPNDLKARNIADEYMFGPSFLVAPITEYKARSREVYLPAGTRWYDFHTGEAFNGGQSIVTKAPLETIPLFVKEGAIVPIGAAVQYTDEKPGAPLTLLVYAGKDGHFDLYEDDGKSLGYQRGAFARIPLQWSESTGTLTIGARTGSFPGMVARRVITIRWISGVTKNAANFEAKADATVTYDGALIAVKRP
ncbi:MAG: glycoside hydrolase family 31 protein [Rhizomicrobium sp.]|nr:glycoside hydrolase family 31 protein [Rhizomicrobium sp.]